MSDEFDDAELGPPPVVTEAGAIYVASFEDNDNPHLGVGDSPEEALADLIDDFDDLDDDD